MSCHITFNYETNTTRDAREVAWPLPPSKLDGLYSEIPLDSALIDRPGRHGRQSSPDRQWPERVSDRGVWVEAKTNKQTNKQAKQTNSRMGASFESRNSSNFEFTDVRILDAAESLIGYDCLRGSSLWRVDCRGFLIGVIERVWSESPNNRSCGGSTN